MFHNDSTPIPSTAENALDVIKDTIDNPEAHEGIARETAVEALVEAGFSEREAAEQIELLLKRGYLYAVEDEIRVT